MDRVAQRYHSRPSQLLAIDDPYAAYCLDEAVTTFCQGVEAKLEEVPTPKGKRGGERRQANQQRVLNKLLGVTPEETKPKQFKDPMELLKGK